MNENVCTDNRFNLIAKYKAKLIEATNIETSQDEMEVIDNILFRMWQMGWLDKLDAASPWHRVEEPPKYTSRYVVWCGVNWYGEGMHGDFMTANYNTVSGRWSVDCDRAINGPLIGDILYWMPIEPPTGTERSET